MRAIRRGMKTNNKAEFGDFQTPARLARKVCELLSTWEAQPKTLVEPTCGRGNFLFAALDRFPSIIRAFGLDISPDYTRFVNAELEKRPDGNKVEIIEGDFFRTDWLTVLRDLPEPVVVVGNPPWVTSARLSVLGSSNAPVKSNFQKHSGLDAMTGKSNFDISEWMLIRILRWLDGRDAVMGMLCKTTVARKLLSYGWKNNINLSNSAIYQVDAPSFFDASVDACLLVCGFSKGARSQTCRVYNNLGGDVLLGTISSRNGEMIASLELYERWKHLVGDAKRWRSGIKHDCSKVMEFVREGNKYRNGFGELVELDDEYMYPMLKSSEVADNSNNEPKRWMLVPQRSVRDDTSVIKNIAPKTWNYLLRHAEFLDKRKSSIYKKRPRFSVFGVGDYSFSLWKVVISGFYKKLSFKVIGNIAGKPVVLDDTCNFIPCESREEAEHLSSLLNSNIAKEFFEAFIFWDAKRPITVEILRRLDLSALEQEVNKGAHTEGQNEHSQTIAPRLPFVSIE